MSKITTATVKCAYALRSLEAIYRKPIDSDRCVIDATIQRFEFTFELFWKLLKTFLNQQGLDVSFPKAVLQEAFIGDLIQNESVWLSMLHDRNLTSHAYDEKIADDIYARIHDYVPVLRKTFDALEPRFNAV